MLSGGLKHNEGFEVLQGKFWESLEDTCEVLTRDQSTVSFRRKRKINRKGGGGYIVPSLEK